jgi:hypothetical protein
VPRLGEFDHQFLEFILVFVRKRCHWFDPRLNATGKIVGPDRFEKQMLDEANERASAPCIAQLLDECWRVRTTVRNLWAVEEVRATIGKITANASAIEFKAADLNSDVGWANAVAGADYV